MEPNAILILVAAVAAITSTFLYLLHVLRKGKQRKQQLITTITTIDEERKRIMADLHDELGPLLSIVKMQVTHLQAKIGSDTEVATRAVQNLDNLMCRLRAICNQLVPDSILKKDFPKSVADFLSDIKKHSGLQIFLTTDHATQLSEKLHVQLFRVIQEIVNNTIKHANATVLTISIRVQARKQLILSIADNGQGFQVSKVKECCAGGMGIRNIFSRISMLNGIVFVDSMPGEGTKYMIVVPYEPTV